MHYVNDTRLYTASLPLEVAKVCPEPGFQLEEQGHFRLLTTITSFQLSLCLCVSMAVW